MKFQSVDAAQDWATTHGRMIYVEIDGAKGVLQVYPGGRKSFVAADKGKIYERWRKRLTPDSEFAERDESEECPHGIEFCEVCPKCCVCECCGALGEDPCDPDCEEMSL